MNRVGGNRLFNMPNDLVGIFLGYDSYDHGSWNDKQHMTIIEASNKIRLLR